MGLPGHELTSEYFCSSAAMPLCVSAFQADASRSSRLSTSASYTQMNVSVRSDKSHAMTQLQALTRLMPCCWEHCHISTGLVAELPRAMNTQNTRSQQANQPPCSPGPQAGQPARAAAPQTAPGSLCGSLPLHTAVLCQLSNITLTIHRFSSMPTYMLSYRACSPSIAQHHTCQGDDIANRR